MWGLRQCVGKKISDFRLSWSFELSGLSTSKKFSELLKPKTFTKTETDKTLDETGTYYGIPKLTAIQFPKQGTNKTGNFGTKLL